MFVRPTGRKRVGTTFPTTSARPMTGLGIPEAEKKYLSGVKAQYESEVVYGSLLQELTDKGVIFTDTDSALRDHPELFREYFGTVIPPQDNKFAALNSAVWSGGSFIYVPPGVKIDYPLQAYFRINSENMGQFERTLIIVDEGASCHYVEGLHRADLHDRQPAQRGRRSDREEERPVPLHDDSELVEQRLQPGDQTGLRLRRLANGVGRWQPRLATHDEVPGHLPDGAGGPRRDVVDRLREQRAAPGRRGEDGSHGPAHVEPHHLEVDQQGGRACELPRAREGGEGGGAQQEQRRLRRPDSRFRQPQRHLPLHRSQRTTTSRSSTRRASRKSPRSSSST